MQCPSHLGATRTTQDVIPMSFDGGSATGTWTARRRPTTTQTTTGREVAIAPGDVSAAQECINSGGKWNPIRYQCDRTVVRQALPQDCPSGHTWSFRTNSCIPFGDPYAQQKAACASRTGFLWNDVRKICESADPYIEAKNRCALLDGRWDSIRNVCQSSSGGTREPTGPLVPVPQPEPYLPPKPPETSVLDQSKSTNGAPASMIDTDRSGGGGSGYDGMFDDRQPERPVEVSIVGGGGRGPAGAPGAAAPAPKWLVPAIIGAAMYLL